MENTIAITLPDSLKSFVDAQVSAGGFEGASDYVAFLLEKAQLQQHRAEIDAKLRDGVASGFSEMTADDWQRLKDRVAQRQASRG
jgi:antitoxin ParD1/3/4